MPKELSMVLSDTQFKSLLIKNKILDEKEVVKLESVAANSRLSLQEAALENQVLSQEECG